jgi:hypothetical protein
MLSVKENLDSKITNSANLCLAERKFLQQELNTKTDMPKNLLKIITKEQMKGGIDTVK